MNILESRFIARAVILACIIFMMKSAYSVAIDIRDTISSRDWPFIEGRIIQIQDRHYRPAGGYYRKDKIIKFTYIVSGIAYEGNRINFHKRSKWYLNDVADFNRQYANSDRINVYYDPILPSRSVIDPGGSNLGNISVLSLQIAIIITLMTIIIMSLPKRNDKSDEQAAPSNR